VGRVCEAIAIAIDPRCLLINEIEILQNVRCVGELFHLYYMVVW